MTTIALQYEHNIKPGTGYESAASLSEVPVTEHSVRYIAYYLPQFHSIPENDEWWGKGFTEWTNVTKALPRYLGHYQPRLPSDFGFYDLSNPDHIRQQVDLAKRAGIYGFCIHNYWHSGRRLLETPLRTILNDKTIDIRFCLNWANESWSRRWDGSESHILVKQNYAPGEDVEYAEYLAEFFADDRYIKINGRPLLMLYRPGHLPDAKATIERWRNFFVKRGFANPYIIMPQAFGVSDPRTFGMDAAAGFPPHMTGFGNPRLNNYLRLLDRRFTGTVISYDDMIAKASANVPDDFRLFPGVCPQWDNEARHPNSGFSAAGSTPAKYGEWLRAASEQALKAPTEDERIVFINAWNEWAEGAYLEPDRHYGFAYLAETLRALQSMTTRVPTPSGIVKAVGYTQWDMPRKTLSNYLRNLPRRTVRAVRHAFVRGQ